jgi:hypothetical protein
MCGAQRGRKEDEEEEEEEDEEDEEEEEEDDDPLLTHFLNVRDKHAQGQQERIERGRGSPKCNSGLAAAVAFATCAAGHSHTTHHTCTTA